MRIFLTGATGYIGGDVLFAILQRFPNLQSDISVLIRNKEKAATVAQLYPALRQVIGDLSDTELIAQEAAESDIVIHCASLDDLPSTRAIAAGLTRRERPGAAFWIAVSGTDNLGWGTIEANSYGEQQDKVYDDYNGIEEILAIPDQAPHRDVELAQLNAASDKVRLAIVSPCCVYGTGRGPGNQRSIQLPDLARYTVEHGTAFRIERGLSRWSNIHVHDLSDVFVRLLEDALQGGGKATWGREGYYFAENGIHVWGEIANSIAQVAHQQGLIASADVVGFTPEEADAKMEYAALFYGTDSACKAVRARKVLGWTPMGNSIEDEIHSVVLDEAQRLGL